MVIFVVVKINLYYDGDRFKLLNCGSDNDIHVSETFVHNQLFIADMLATPTYD